MNLPSEKQLEEFKKWGAELPSHDKHGEDSWNHPISEKMSQAKCWNWHMEGNILKCDTDFGPLSQVMPTNVICTGEKNGVPILREL